MTGAQDGNGSRREPVPREDELQALIESGARERQRLADELQNDTLQNLTALQVRLASVLGGRSSQPLERVGQEVIEQIAAEIVKLRALAAELRPVALDEIGLDAVCRSRLPEG